MQEWIDPVHGYCCDIVGYEFNHAVPHDALEDARRQVNAACAPASETMLGRELARLRVSTKSRDLDETELALTLQVLAEEAAEWPADVAVAAMRRWAKRETFFPSLAELRAEMQAMGRRRLALGDLLRKAENGE